MIVEDHHDAAAMLEMALTMKGHSVRVAHDPAAALAIAVEFQPQVALLDIDLPMMNGYQLAEQLRELRGLGAMLLMAVTGYSEAADRRRSRVAGFHRHVAKPVDVDELDRVLRSFAPD